MSSISRAPSSNHSTGDSPPEESGWTTYFEDFFNNNSERCSISSAFVNSSMISDAASLVAKKLSDREQGDEFWVHKNSRTSSFKKRKKTKAALFDDALEDTASSPVNSPKVFQGNQLDEPNQKEVDFSQEKGSTSGQYERKELGFNGRDSDCSELKKRGLCVLPLSMVVKYLG